MPKISICIPYHQTPKTAFFLSRLLKSIDQQTFKDYEIVLTDEGAMAHNNNAAILKSKGGIVQMMGMDDYFAYADSLEKIIKGFDNGHAWQISACFHDDNGSVGNPHEPYWTNDIYTGNNRLGGISTLSFLNEKRLLFEEPLSWLIDVDLYYRLFLKYGKPFLNMNKNVVIDVGTHRVTHTLPTQDKENEVQYLIKKYVNRG